MNDDSPGQKRAVIPDDGLWKIRQHDRHTIPWAHADRLQVDRKTRREIIEFQEGDAMTVKEKGCRVGKFGDRRTEQVRQGAVRIYTTDRDTLIVVANPRVFPWSTPQHTIGQNGLAVSNAAANSIEEHAPPFSFVCSTRAYTSSHSTYQVSTRSTSEVRPPDVYMSQ